MEAAVQSIQIYPDGQWPYRPTGGHKQRVHMNKEFVTLRIQIRKKYWFAGYAGNSSMDKREVLQSMTNLRTWTIGPHQKKMRDFELEKKLFLWKSSGMDAVENLQLSVGSYFSHMHHFISYMFVSHWYGEQCAMHRTFYFQLPLVALSPVKW